MQGKLVRSGWELLAGMTMAMFALVGCGGGGGSTAAPTPGGGGPPPPSGTSTPTYTVGGMVSGLPSGQSVTLVNNGANPLTVVANGAFLFSQGLPLNSPYDVTVQSTSPGARCALGYYKGTSSSNVTGVAVTCVASTDTLLHSFGFSGTTTDGASPRSRLLMDSAGNLYGTTYYGGTHEVEFQGDGTIFKISPNGTETVLYSFAGGTADGANPAAGLIMDSFGNLYGTTANRGANGQGTVFKLSADGTETVLHSFPNSATDGMNPAASLVMDNAGNLYGTTRYGGTNNDGTVFKIDANGVETVLHSFAGTPDGANPVAGLVLDSAGNLYGTTPTGGANNNGTVFKISAAGTESVLYSFGTGTDGKQPNAALLMDSAGNFYGTTMYGGAFGWGAVFKISAIGAESLLYSFTGGTDGEFPIGELIMDGTGNLYGTTSEDTVFKLAANGTETVLHDFASSPVDGQGSMAGLVMDTVGNLYGTTTQGGVGFGSVFEITASTIATSGSGSNPTYVVGGTVSGLLPQENLTLLNNGTDLVGVGNGGFDFPTRLAPGDAYNVILRSGTAIPCVINNGSGTVGSTNVTSIAVVCTAPTFTVGGTVSGLNPGDSVTLLDNGGDALTVSANGAFTFATAVAEASAYDVTVQSTTSRTSCQILGAGGTIGTSNVTNIDVRCAPREAVLYSFAATDGKGPLASLVMDGAGNLYGTTATGGANGYGTVFKISASGTGSVLHSFVGGMTDGANPAAALIMDSTGNFYGTTQNGGAYGYGTVFKLSADGTESILHSFACCGTDGEYPVAALIMDSAGNLYGTTQGGGTLGDGTVFKISANGTESVLYSFATSGVSDGANPLAPLIMDSAGNLYGTTSGGGAHGVGTVFKVSATGAESVLYSFTGAADGGNPTAALVMDRVGNLYGTTQGSPPLGEGTVFELTTSGTEITLHTFGAGVDGVNPRGALIMDSAGNLYGTTSGGGEGILFKLAADGTETILHAFGSTATDGRYPVAGLIMDGAGNMYGTTQEGGANGDGTVFELF